MCERCKENEAVCIWDLHGEYYECNVCEKCCSELAKSRQEVCKNKPMRRKADPFCDVKYASLCLLYVFVAMLTWAFRDPHINYLEIFKLDNLLSFFCLTALGHFSTLLLSYNKKESKVYFVLIIGLEIICGIFGACAVFNNRFKWDFLSIVTIICLTITVVIAISLLIIQKIRKTHECMPAWLKCTVIMIGFVSAMIAMILISIKDMIEQDMFGF